MFLSVSQITYTYIRDTELSSGQWNVYKSDTDHLEN